jgi:DNA helicase II / ATP-dependent DNA helicase PcrA
MSIVSDPRQLILDTSGHILVRGGAGSGKTTIALRKALQRIDEGLAEGQSVLFLSFSKSAVHRISQASKIEALNKRKSLALQTFHSFCWDLLRTHGYLLGAPRKLRILLPQDERVLSNGAEQGTKDWATWEIERGRLFSEEGQVVFDLFAPLAADLLHRSALIRHAVAERFPLVVVDEAQDTGPDAWRCIQELSQLVPVICLADLEQQIFDHLHGVGPERVAAIEKSLCPLCVDLGSHNNRSPGTEIAAFANDILTGKVRSAPYHGVSTLRYHPLQVDFPKLIRQALGVLAKKIEQQTGSKPESCAILAPYGTGVARIAAALSAGQKPIPHKVLFDEAEVLLSARIAAFLLEPKQQGSQTADVAILLELLAALKRATGTKTGLLRASQLLLWASHMRQGRRPRASLVSAADQLIVSSGEMRMSGNPSADWLLVKALLRNNQESCFSAVATNLDYIVAFNRGKRISANLAEVWSDHGSYRNAREAFDAALAEDQILSGIEDLTGIHVMTIHRSKGKQFDGVIILREGQRTGAKTWSSSFVWRGDHLPYYRSRRILRVGITRAMKHVLILDPVFPNCPLLAGHKL